MRRGSGVPSARHGAASTRHHHPAGRLVEAASRGVDFPGSQILEVGGSSRQAQGGRAFRAGWVRTSTREQGAGWPRSACRGVMGAIFLAEPCGATEAAPPLGRSRTGLAMANAVVSKEGETQGPHRFARSSSLGVPMRGPPQPGLAVRNGPCTAMGWTKLSGWCEAHCRHLGSPTPRVVVCRAKASPLRHPCRLSPEANIDVASDGANSQLVRNPGLLGGALAGLLHSSRACWTGKES